MSTPYSSVHLRRAVDAVATPRHEAAFRVLDLLLVGPGPRDGGPRADLRGDLCRLRAELDEHGGR